MNALPTVNHKGKRYFIDWRLQEFRPVDPPLESIPFDSELGREIDGSWGDGQTQEDIESLEKGDAAIIRCPRCGNDTFIGYAQGYTSDDRPYPVGSCCCCDMELPALDDEKDVELMMEFRGQHWNEWVKFCLEQRVQPVVEDTKIVRISGKNFHFEVDHDGSDGVKAVRLTECGDPDEIEMLEAYDLETIE